MQHQTPVQSCPARRLWSGPLLLLALALTACGPLAEPAIRKGVIKTPAPTILPLDDLLEQAAASKPSDDPAAELATRAAALRARAHALRGQTPGSGT
jgi:hypothetical protein